jgi:hypothetical protein
MYILADFEISYLIGSLVADSHPADFRGLIILQSRSTRRPPLQTYQHTSSVPAVRGQDHGLDQLPRRGGACAQHLE